MKILCLGDIVGKKGIFYAKQNILKLKEKENFEAYVINIENSAESGKGPCEEACKEFENLGAPSVYTGGNHSFSNKNFFDKYSSYKNCLRPCNFPKEAPGSGYFITILENGRKMAVINVQLRTFMRENLSCPFRAVESILTVLKNTYKDSIIIIDVHGETTAEKITFANYFDGKVSAIFGTHTHVQTNDARILKNGTAYITDLGMTGALNSSLGVKFEGTTYNFITQLPTKFVIEDKPPFISSGIILEFNEKSSFPISIKTVNEIFD